MDPQRRASAESRLAEAAHARGLADPRPPYRERLRWLRLTHPDAFDRAIQHYEEQVLPALAQDEPLPVWVEYGRFLASLTARGQVLRIDESGRAAPWSTDAHPALVLFVPDEAAADVLVLCQPAAPTPAQRATVGLLVERRLGMEFMNGG